MPGSPDAASVHELGRCGLFDEEQFEFATDEGRIVVTRNRDDFLRLVITAFQAGLPSPGALVVPRALPNSHPASSTHALKRCDDFQREDAGPGLCIVDFLS